MSDLAATVDLLQLVGEPTRVRLLALLAEKELSVADLVAITELGQSRISMHLARLRDAGLVVDRRDGAATFYSLNERSMDAGARRVWAFLRSEVHDAQIDRDRLRRETLLRNRARQGWPDAVAGQMEKHYSPGRTWESLARGLVGLVQLGDVLDAGSGDGTIAQLLAPRARSFTLLDHSPRMIAAAGQRLKKVKNVGARVGDVQDPPFEPESFDTVLLFNVLTEVERPDAALAGARRVLRPDGLVAVITLDAHEHEEPARAYRHLHLGFSPSALRKLLVRHGFVVETCEVTSREKRPPRFRVVTAFARAAGRNRP
jgi:DNA-binding transcriptional ArsR family regulator